MSDYTIPPDQTVYWCQSTTHQGARGPVIHIDRDCSHLQKADNVRVTERRVLYTDSDICTLCKVDSDLYPEVTERPGGRDPDAGDTDADGTDSA
jgi:hypothetical protein